MTLSWMMRFTKAEKLDLVTNLSESLQDARSHYRLKFSSVEVSLTETEIQKLILLLDPSLEILP